MSTPHSHRVGTKWFISPPHTHGASVCVSMSVSVCVGVRVRVCVCVCKCMCACKERIGALFVQVIEARWGPKPVSVWNRRVGERVEGGEERRERGGEREGAGGGIGGGK